MIYLTVLKYVTTMLCLHLNHILYCCFIFCFSHPVFRSPVAVSNRPDTVLAPLPFYHVYGLSVIQFSNLFMGNTIVVLPAYSLKRLLHAIETYKVSTTKLMNHWVAKFFHLFLCVCHSIWVGMCVYVHICVCVCVLNYI